MTLACTDAGHLAWPLRTLSGAQAVRARCILTLSTIQGERPEDVRVGLPMEWIEGAPVPPGQAEAVVRSQLRRVRDVQAVDAVTVSDSSGARRIGAVVTARTVDGLVRLTVGEPLPYDTRGAPAWYMTTGALRTGRGPSWPGGS